MKIDLTRYSHSFYFLWSPNQNQVNFSPKTEGREVQGTKTTNQNQVKIKNSSQNEK
jgi:hypothetical protein